ncbi:MAG: Holliday junction resolvase RuvX [Sediminibacterium sp.]|jgi:putative Holliday junction resolvase|nr:Holliday junction resolvase RuvX [Chitinophagaceae bacterium]MCA6446087.1 Holliday junction resolvase RuvX [Chitinophagaceae bacterium]
MARIICIDYGGKRTGLAVTDPLQIIATALDTIDTKDFISYLKKYCSTETVELFLIGEPLNLDDTPTHATSLVHKAIASLQKNFPNIPVKKVDERYSSKMAVRAMVDMGMKKKDRRIKGNIDQIAAVMLLQEYLANRN